MEFILVSGIGTFVLLAVQLFDYLRDSLRRPVFDDATPLTAEQPPQAPASPPPDLATWYDRAA